MAEVYFLYSQEQLNEKNAILNKSGKEFVPGTVVLGGVKRNFTTLSSKSEIPRFFDTQIVARGEISNFTYTLPIVKKKGTM